MSKLITVVSGTYNRLAYLQRMIQSARDSLPESLAPHFVIVDGGSTDGTLDWLRSQEDVTLIEHGELRGAIPAFCDGARAADTPYVLLANDDISFVDDAILRALVYIDKHPRCGAVAFADNRPAPGYRPGEYKTQTMGAVAPDGSVTGVIYAQVGLFRRDVGDIAGWWGDKDPIMGKARTYGGDNYLSARIWELGHTVDPVPGAICNDHIPQDGLRERNQVNPSSGMHPDSAAYYERFPNGPHLPAPIQIADENEWDEWLRVLYLPIYEPGPIHATHKRNKRGLREAMQRRGFLVYEWDYATEPGDLVEMVKTFEPHLMLSQFQGVGNITPAILAAARAAKPDMGVINWNGDAHIENLTGEDILKLLRHVDLQLVVNAAALPHYKKLGIRAEYWQIGYELPAGPLPDLPGHDVVFLGNCYNAERRELEIVLRRKFKELSLGFYGGGWLQSDGGTLYDFAAGEALYQRSKIALGDSFPGEQRAFVSNRFIQALAAGAFLLHQRVEGLEQYTGLKAGVHYVEWKTLRDLQTMITYWLRPENEAERRKIAEQGRAFVCEHYSFDKLLDQLFGEILPRVFNHVAA